MTIVQRWATTDKEGEPTGLHLVDEQGSAHFEECIFLSHPLGNGSEDGYGYQSPDAVEVVDPVRPTRGDLCVCENPECGGDLRAHRRAEFRLTYVDEVSAEHGCDVCCPWCQSYDVRRIESSGRGPLI